jgi:threonyl-tRNA synthetase
MGSLERFFGCLVEHYAGAFPLWLAPVQVILLPITDQNQRYTDEVFKKLINSGFRVEKDLRNEKIGFKIREAQLQKIPYMVVLGEKERASNKLAVRKRRSKETVTLSIDEFIDKISLEVGEKHLGEAIQPI